jgi:hypothetical protein
VAGVTGAVWQLQSGSPASADVATADSWSTLTGELAGGDGTRTVTLGADISAPAGASPVVAMPGGSSVTVDLHGHKLAMGREAGDLKIIVPHGSLLSVEDTTAGSDGPPASAIPLGGSSGYAGYGGLTHSMQSASPQPGLAPAGAARVYGPIVEPPARVRNEAPADHADHADHAAPTTAAPTAPATHSTKSAARHAKVASDVRHTAHTAHSAARDERARGRHRRENVARHSVHSARQSRDCDCQDNYYWGGDDGWWLDPDEP